MSPCNDVTLEGSNDLKPKLWVCGIYCSSSPKTTVKHVRQADKNFDLIPFIANKSAATGTRTLLFGNCPSPKVLVINFPFFRIQALAL